METMAQGELIFLKLGGSLITDKRQAHTARLETLARLAGETAAALQAQPGLRLVLGHGSGSFGHVPARRYGTRQGVRTADDWRGFVEVGREAAALNRLVMDALAEAGAPVVAFPPSACVSAADGQVRAWNLAPLQAALSHGLAPVVFGDVVFDEQRGGTILSTEDLFTHLAAVLRPQRVLLAGIEPGVWADFPDCTRLVETITPGTLAQAAGGLHGSAATDVTGGMASKVELSLRLAAAVPGLEVRIFSGEQPGVLQRALAGEPAGTLITAAP
ncbi:MAG: isopentenyl phosphate kinase [Chloroflexota bacterium]